MTMDNELSDMIAAVDSDNLFLQCRALKPDALRPLPAGFTARLCRQEELALWKDIWAQGKYMDFVNYYYERVYAPREEEFFHRCIFVVDEKDTPVATSGIWRSYGKINTVLGFFVLPEYEGRGIGRGLFSEVMKNAELPVYAHTHTEASRAVKLYSDFGFELIIDPIVGYRENNLQESLPYLKKSLSKKDYANLRMTQASAALLEAALLNEFAEF